MPFHFWLSRISEGATYMDALHHDVATALMHLPSTKDAEFQERYELLLYKLERIFRAEERWMEEIRFPELKHHREQHASILDTLYYGRSQLSGGNTQFGRNIIENLLPEWLHFHATTMDSALARELRVAALT
jgi:methyl-accepting chemotaxis protein